VTVCYNNMMKQTIGRNEREQFWNEMHDSFVQSLRIIAWITITAVGIFIIEDWFSSPDQFMSLLPAKLLAAGVLLGVLYLTRTPWGGKYAEALFLVFYAAMMVTVVYQSSIVREAFMAPVAAILGTIVSAILLPWRGRYHVIIVSVSIAAVLASAYLLSEPPYLPPSREFMAGLVFSCASIFFARHTNQRRLALWKAETTLRESEERFRQFAENSQDIVWIWSPDREIQYVGPAYRHLTGHQPEELYGNPVQVVDVVHPDDRSALEKAIQDIMKGKFRTMDLRVIHADGTVYFLQAWGAPIRDHKGRMVRCIGIWHDITERKLAEEQLASAYAESNRHLAEAAHYVKALLPEPITQGTVTTSWRFVPSSALGGDSFGYHWLDDHHFAVYLVDVCGHGVKAALLAVTVINVLRSRALKDTDFAKPGQVLEALNNTFPMEQQNNMYFTMWYGVYDKSARRLSYACGGHPPALLFTGRAEEDGRMIRLKTPNLFIGGMPGMQFKTAEVELDGPCRLYVFSDGVYEVQESDGRMWEFADFEEFMVQSCVTSSLPIERLYKYVTHMNNNESLEDDFSILEVAFS
jgi:PAS domain S-box-containing protein